MKPTLPILTLAIVCAFSRVASASIVPAGPVDLTFEFTPTGYYDDAGDWQTYTTPSYFTVQGTDTGGDLSEGGSIVAWDINSPYGGYTNNTGFGGPFGSATWTDNAGTGSMTNMDVTFTGPFEGFPIPFIWQTDEITGSSSGSAQMDFEVWFDFYFADPTLDGSLSFAPNGIPAPDTATTALLLAGALGAMAFFRRRCLI